MKESRQKPHNGGGQGYILGRGSFAKISEVEGIRLTAGVAREFRDFERKDLSAEERRRIIGKKYGGAG